jgi:hypothetical protein
LGGLVRTQGARRPLGEPPDCVALLTNALSIAGRLKARTLGHASLAIYRDGEPPLLLTDPWLVGSVYWRSWWLQHYPSADDIAWLQRTAHIYVTHEHPDHFHMPSIRRLGAGPAYLFPDLAECGFLRHMREQGFAAETAPPRRWLALGHGIAMMSIPLWNDDSLLLIDTPRALILNLNDAKPPPPVLRALRRLADHLDKPRIVLCSYSPASVVNSFLDENGIVRLRQPRHYVDYISRLCDRLGAHYYLPFASQAIFCRADSQWANAYRTTYDDLRRNWRARAQLLPPYTTLDLDDFSHSSIPADAYRQMDAAILARHTGERAAAEEAAEISPGEEALLKRKLDAFRWLFLVLFPRGFAFRLGERWLVYDSWRRRLSQDPGAEPGDFIVDVPKATMKQALSNNHLSDLGITMFVRIRLLRHIDPRRAYGLFVLFQFEDYGHLAGIVPFLRWVGRGLRSTFAQRLPLPTKPR